MSRLHEEPLPVDDLFFGSRQLEDGDAFIFRIPQHLKHALQMAQEMTDE
jgi:hypothetical protein